MSAEILWVALETQVGGHKLGIYDQEDGSVLKSLQAPPRGTRELDFYNKLFDKTCCDPDLIELRHFVPNFFGSIVKEGTTFARLKNLTGHLKHPCVLDIKLGGITYDQNATQEKIDLEVAKYPLAVRLGFRFTGMKVYNPVTGQSKMYGKDYGYNITEDTVLSEGFKTFFGSGNGELRHEVIYSVLRRLRHIESWFVKQKKLSFIGSSLLITYEGSKNHSVSEGSGDSQINVDNQRNGKQNGSECKLSDKSTYETSASPNIKSQCENPVQNQNCVTDAPVLKKLKLDSSKLDDKIHDSSENCSNSEANSKEEKAEVHLIDFAHVYPTNKTDENVLFGLQKIIGYLESLVGNEQIN